MNDIVVSTNWYSPFVKILSPYEKKLKSEENIKFLKFNYIQIKKSRENLISKIIWFL